MKRVNIFFALSFLFVIAVLLIIFVLPEFDSNNSKNGSLYISEVMAQNNYTLMDDDNKYSDWIEIYNGYSYDINLEGYKLTDKLLNTGKWTFPSVTIKSNSYLIVYASGKDKCNLNVCHTNFKLSSDGEVVMLLDNNSNVISKLTFSKTDSDTSYGLLNNKYVYFYKATPGTKNSGETSKIPINRGINDIGIYINEYMNSNERTLYDEDGDYSSWIELYNSSNDDVNLEGMHITDDESNINKYTFASAIIKSKEYLVVFLSGKEKKYKNGSELHASFKLSKRDTSIMLTDKYGNTLDKLKLVTLDDNISYGKYNDEWYYFTTPTPNTINNTERFEKVDGLLKKKVVINEVSAVDELFVELKNISNETINLNNYKFYDKKKSEILTIPDINLSSGEYLIIKCSSDNNLYKDGILYSKIKLNHDKEVLTLEDNYGTVIDSYTTGRLTANTSFGLDNSGNHVYFLNKTEGRENSETTYLGYASTPIFNINGGYIESNTKITLKVSDNSEVYYTTDGSFPNKNSIKYDGAITVNKTTTIKAISYKVGYIESEVVSRTFFIGRVHDLPITAISTNKEYLFGDGIYDSNSDEEEEISFEFYENDGTLGISFNGGARLIGNDSRNYPQKSISIFLRKEYGLQEITYPLFTDHFVQTFSSFVLRNGGEDVAYYKVKDAYLVEVLKGQMDIDFQYYRPVVLYINGEYFGIYNIREKINEDYVANNHNIDKDNVDIIKGNDEVTAGTYENYNNLLNYVSTHDTTKKEVYEYLKTQIDMTELMNYWIVQTYYNNIDSGNIRFYRENTDTGKWRWILFDQDWAMFPTTYTSINLMKPFLPYGHGTGNWFSTTLTYKLYKNSEFKDKYLKLFSYHLENTFNPDRMIKIWDNVTNEIKSEMPYNIERWSSEFSSNGYSMPSMSEWNNSIEYFKKMIQNRYDIVLKNLKSEFNLTDSEYEYYFGRLK